VELELVEEPQGLVQVPTQGVAVHVHLPHDVVLVHDDDTPAAKAAFFEDIVLGGDFFFEVTEQGIIDVHFKATLFLLQKLPALVLVMGVGGAAEDLAVPLLELREELVKAGDLRLANEGEVLRVEEEHDVLSPVLLETNLLEGVIGHALRDGKLGGLLVDQHFSFRYS